MLSFSVCGMSFRSPLEDALDKLVARRGQLALILGAEEDNDVGVPQDNTAAENLLARWGRTWKRSVLLPQKRGDGSFSLYI